MSGYGTKDDGPLFGPREKVTAMHGQPAPTHHDGPDTEVEAAEKLTPDTLTGLRVKCFDVVTSRAELGATPSEVADAIPNSYLPSIRPRLTELMQAGIICDSGMRRENARGNNEIVYVVDPRVPKCFDYNGEKEKTDGNR